MILFCELPIGDLATVFENEAVAIFQVATREEIKNGHDKEKRVLSALHTKVTWQQKKRYSTFWI